MACWLASSCAWATCPTAGEFYAAVRAEEPSDPQRSLIAMWVREATNAELLMAWVFPLRLLLWDDWCKR